MIKHILLAAALLISGLCASAQNEQTGDSITPPGDVKYKHGVYYRIVSLLFRDAALAGFISGQEREEINVPTQFYDSISGATYTVTQVAPGAFKGQKILKKVTIPNTVTRICKDAFNGCSIDSIAIPGIVYHVEEGAFADNPLKAVYLCDYTENTPYPDNYHSIELQTNAFGNANDPTLKNVYINYAKPPIVEDGATPFPHVATYNGSAKLHLSDAADKNAYEHDYCWTDFFKSDAPVGVEEIPTSPEAPAEYYTLQGVRVDNANLSPGIYIVRANGHTSKTLVR